MSCAMKAMLYLYCTMAITAESAMKTRIRPRIVPSRCFSPILTPFRSAIKSRVSVELAVSTRDDRVDMEAASTSTTTRPSSSGEKCWNIVGMMAS